MKASYIIVSPISVVLVFVLATSTVTAFVTQSTNCNRHSSTSTSLHSTFAQLIEEPITWNSVIGEADRAFRRGIQLDKSGQPRLASGDFHQAATLYQCYLDLPENFGHVTSLTEDDCRAVLAYTLVRLGFLNVDALSDPAAAIRLYTMASEIDPNPSAVSFKGIGTAVEAAGGNGNDLEHLQQAVAAYRQALERSQKASIFFYLAVALERLGQKEESEPILESMQRSEAPASCLVDSWGYVRWHMRKVPPEVLNLHLGTRDMLKLALDAAMPLIERQRESKFQGLVCEFGVGSGRSLRMTQEILPLDIEIHGFDTFTGLPQAWGSEPAGAYSTGGIVPNMEGEVYFHKGLFSDTISPFLNELGDDAFLAYANIDCDLYTSTLDILESFHGRIGVGTIIVFDEYICHPTWRQDEFRAWRECCKRFGWTYEYLAFSLPTKQAVVRVTSV
ncbi:macrocin-O-methyltransferase [Nitzschia inconspicua]|uniref:Macrocin-O-methyltransferase n=1 Tax=Nitzschia inconspicua TaxID=303405 RepID=A0A9K3L9B1_9STRA|nr:macrocin-O-methyltransferase [Nitzschia inconspicua]